MSLNKIKSLAISLIISLSIVSCSAELEEPLFPVVDDTNALPQPSPRELDQDLMIIYQTVN